MSQEVYFKNIQTKIAELLENADFSIKIAVAWLTDEKLINILTKKIKNGIEVTVIIYDDNINQKELFYSLSKSGGTVYYSKKLMHNKFCIIDEKIVINGSYNWTNSAKSNHENITVLRDSVGYTKKFISEFNSLLKLSHININFEINNFNEVFENYYDKIKNNISLPFFLINNNSKFNNTQEYYFIENEIKKKLAFFIIEVDKQNLNNKTLTNELNEKLKEVKNVFFNFVDNVEFVTEYNSKNYSIGLIKENCLAYNFDDKYRINGTVSLINKFSTQIESSIKVNGCGYNPITHKLNKKYIYSLIKNDKCNQINIFDENLKLIYKINYYDYFKFIDKELIILRKNNKYGVENYEGKIIIDYIFDELQIHDTEKIEKIDFIQLPKIIFNHNNAEIFEQDTFLLKRKIENDKNFFKNDKNISFVKYLENKRINFKVFVFNKKGTLINSTQKHKQFYAFSFFEYDLKLKGLKYALDNNIQPKGPTVLHTLYSNIKTSKESLIFIVGQMLTKEDFRLIIEDQDKKLNEIRNNSNCFIATYAYEDINHPKVEKFRYYRDNKLIHNFYGKYLIKLYYIISPFLVRLFKLLNFPPKYMRVFLDFLIKSL